MDDKQCSKCGQNKPVRAFYRKSSVKSCGLTAACKDCLREPARIVAANWRQANPGRTAQNTRNYRDRNRVRIREEERQRRASDPVFRFVKNARTRIYLALKKGPKYAKTESLVGCSFDQLLGLMEFHFLPGMSWENYGQWHVDHIKPCAIFNLSDPAQQQECFHYSNLQPMWGEDNMRKGARV